MANQHSISRLLEIMSALRHPERGCPWDRKQTFESIVPHTLEEAYEVADAIETRQWDELPAELGDLLFQVVFYAEMGKEQQLFDFNDVVDSICQKLIARHPHVFDGVKLDEKGIQLNWESSKAKERKAKQQYSVMDNVPVNLPALSRSIKIQKRAANVGFDWDDLQPVASKVSEELNEVLAEALADKPEQKRVTEELGDLLFAVTNLARHLKVDPEQALRIANTKFEQRFRKVEQLCEQRSLAINLLDLQQLEAHWQRVKAQEDQS